MACEWCNDTGLCCPECRGQGKLARRRKGLGSELVLCPTCHVDMSDGAQFDPAATMRAIERYIEDWFAGVAPDEVLTRRKEDERIRAEVEARRAAQPSRGIWRHG